MGQFNDGRIHGKGTYHYANGTVENGTWSKGNFVG